MEVIMVVMVVMLMVTASALTLENVHFQPNKGRGELKELRYFIHRTGRDLTV